MNGKLRQEARRSGARPSRSWMFAGCGFEHEATPLGVDDRMSLASVDLLSSIVTARATGLGDLDALAVDDRGRGAGGAPGPFAVCHHHTWFIRAPVIAPGANQR